MSNFSVYRHEYKDLHSSVDGRGNCQLVHTVCAGVGQRRISHAFQQRVGDDKEPRQRNSGVVSAFQYGGRNALHTVRSR